MNKWKQFFGTPKKIAVSLVCVAAALAFLGMGMFFATTAIAKDSSIGEENARNFAFADIGIDPLSAESVEIEFGFQQGQFVYEIEFTADGMEYQYWIKASDGSVVKKEVDLTDDGNTHQQNVIPSQVNAQPGQDAKSSQEEAANTQSSQEGTQPREDAKSSQEGTQPREDAQQSQDNNSQISLDTAKEMAVSDAGVSSSDVTYTKAEIEYDDGVAVYEIEFFTSTHEYEYEIDASSGTIKSKDKEGFGINQKNRAGNEGNSASDIGMDQAKSIAASHAGFSVSDVTFSKAKLESEHGSMIYEIKFYKDGMEYEYEVDAASGEILKFDSWWDD